MREEKVSMPMGSAGIIGFSPDMRISGIEIDPKILVGVVLIAVFIVVAANYAVR